MNMQAKASVALVFCLLIATPGCYHPTKIKSRKVFITRDKISALKSKVPCFLEAPTITVWIHGTRLLPTRTLQNFVYCAAGLHHAVDLPQSYFLRQLSDALILADPARFNANDFYLFGWTGKLDAMVREQAAKDLHADFKNIIAEYQKVHGKTPRIRLITHSHGGNVALNLARFKELNPELVIDELILLACPVQGSTKRFLKDPMFKNIYTMFSSIDLAQVLAPQLYWPAEDDINGKKKFHFPPISSRIFPNQNNLIQAKIKMNGHAIMHTEFSGDQFTQYLPLLLDELRDWNETDPQCNDTPYTNRLLKIYTH